MKRKAFIPLCFVIVAAILFNIGHSFVRVQEISAQVTRETIIIDVGHGGEDGGAVGVNQILEKNINLSISLLLKELFEKNGYSVMMTRDGDYDLGNKNLDTVMERKRSDIKKRVEIIAKSKADLVLSIHQNHFGQSKYHGAQIFYASESSKILADTLQRTIVAELQPENTRMAKKTDGVYILNHTEIPSVIIECGFISNHEEAKLLATDEYQLKIAEAIFKATSRFLNE